MKNKINFYLIEYAIDAILRAKMKNSFIFIIFVFLIFILSSIFFISNSIKSELISTVESLPQIIVQNSKAGRIYDIDLDVADEIVSITGVEDVSARVWGYYYFQNANVNFTLVGIDKFENQYKNSFQNIVDNFKTNSLDDNSMVIGIGVDKVMKENYYKKYFNFILQDGTTKKINIESTFKSITNLESNDMIMMSKENIREIFNIDENSATDLVVSVSNPQEIPNIVEKIKLLYPNTRVITNDDIKISYQNIFDYKGGVFLALFCISLFTFFIIIYDKSSGLSSEEKKEIAILKAIGWTIDDVLKWKFIEGFIISILAYIFGVLLAFVFVYLLQAPLLRDIFIGYSNIKTSFELPFVFDIQTLFLVFFLSVPVYIASTIIPSWRSATQEADENIR